MMYKSALIFLSGLLFVATSQVFAQSDRLGTPTSQPGSNNMEAASQASESKNVRNQSRKSGSNTQSTRSANRQNIGKLSVNSRNQVQGDVNALSQSSISIGNANIGGAINNSITGPDMGNITGPDMGNITGPDMGNITGPDMGNITGPDMGNITGPDMGNITGPDMENITGPDMGNITGPDMGNITEQPVGQEIPYSLLLDNPEMRQLEQDYLYALMSKCAYSKEDCTASYRETLEKRGWAIGEIVEPLGWASSSEYQTFINHNTKEVVVAFRGTEPGFMGLGFVAQIPANAGGALGLPTINTGIALTEEYVDAGYTLTYTGHSKGGGEAIAEAENNPDSKAVVFNPRHQYFSTSDVFAEDRAHGYYVGGEILSATRLGRNGYYEKLDSDKSFIEVFDKHGMQTVIDSFEKTLGID